MSTYVLSKLIFLFHIRPITFQLADASLHAFEIMIRSVFPFLGVPVFWWASFRRISRLQQSTLKTANLSLANQPNTTKYHPKMEAEVLPDAEPITEFIIMLQYGHVLHLKGIILFQIFLVLNMDEEFRNTSTELGICSSIHQFAHLNQVIFSKTNRIPLAFFCFLLPVLFLGKF
jgi:hypothetical protein